MRLHCLDILCWVLNLTLKVTSALIWVIMAEITHAHTRTTPKHPILVTLSQYKGGIQWHNPLNHLDTALLAHIYSHTHTPHTHNSHTHILLPTPGQWGLLRKNSTCSSIWKLFREASNSIRAGLIAVASSQSPNHSVSQLAPRPFHTRMYTHTHAHTYSRNAQHTPIPLRPLWVPPGNESPSAASKKHLRPPHPAPLPPPTVS